MDERILEGVQDMAEMAMRQAIPKDTLAVEFYYEAIKNEEKSKHAGRPIYEDQEFISIRIPGEVDVRRRPVKPEDKLRWAEKYRLWKENEDQTTLDGFPLKLWTQITEAQRKELAFFGILTVEQLAATTDANIQRIGHYMTLRAHAKDWLEQAKKGSALVKIREENEELRKRIAFLEHTVKEQTEEIARARADGSMKISVGGEGDRMAALEAKLAILGDRLSLLADRPDPPAEETPKNGAAPPPKRRGRPPGSKNKPKPVTEA